MIFILIPDYGDWLRIQILQLDLILPQLLLYSELFSVLFNALIM